MPATDKHPILLVDDEPEILFSLQSLLRLEFDLHTAQSGAEALEILHRQPIHVIMTDQRMPNMTGVELLRKVHGECPDAVRLLFTGYADLKAVIEAVNEGQIHRYLTKPWDPDDLITVLHEACKEYDVIAGRKRLLLDLRNHLSESLEQMKGGSFSPVEEERFLRVGRTLLARLDESLATGKTAGP